MIEEKEVIKLQIGRQLKSLARHSICILEEYQRDGLLSEAEFTTKRKGVLDKANNSIRYLEQFLEDYDVSIKGY